MKPSYFALIKIIISSCFASSSAGKLFLKTKAKDKSLPKAGDSGPLDTCSFEIQLPGEFKFLDDTYENVWVCENGFLSFSLPSNLLKTAYPTAFPIEWWRKMGFAGPAIVAPLWSNIDIRGERPPEEVNTISWRVKRDGKDLTEVNSLLNEHKAKFSSFEDDFEAAWVFVATWDKVGYYYNYGLPHWYDKVDKVNTFQAVLTCNNETLNQCFVVLSYQDVEWDWRTIEWVKKDKNVPTEHIKYNLTLWENAVAGIDNGKGDAEMIAGSQLFHTGWNLPYAYGKLVRGRNLTQLSNVDVPGLFIFAMF